MSREQQIAPPEGRQIAGLFRDKSLRKQLRPRPRGGLVADVGRPSGGRAVRSHPAPMTPMLREQPKKNLGATLHSPRRRVPGHASGIAEFQPTRLCPAVTLPCLKVWAEPVRPEASCPCVGIEHAQSENTPLFRAPCRVEPKRLTKDPENTRPPLPAFTRVLRKPDRDEATKGDADLIQAQQGLLPDPHHIKNVAVRWWFLGASFTIPCV